MKKLIAFILSNVEEIVTAIFLAALLLLTIFNVTLRFTTGRSLVWTEEVSFGCFAWVVFLGASAAYKRHLHSSVEILVQTMPKRFQQVVETVTYVALLLTLGVITYFSLRFSIAAHFKVTPVLKIPYTYIDISVCVGCLLMSVHTVKYLADILRGRRPGEDKLWPGVLTIESPEFDAGTLDEEGGPKA